jgi:hypothetical protein
LVPVNVRQWIVSPGRLIEEVVEHVPRLEGERGLLGSPVAPVTKSAGIELSLAREVRGVHHMPVCRISTSGGVVLEVTTPITMALPARDTQGMLAGVQHATAVASRVKGSTVAFQAAGEYGTIEIDEAVVVSRTVDPLPQLGEVGHR